MSTIISQYQELEQNSGDLETTSTTLINRQGRKFSTRPIAVVSQVDSITQTSVNEVSIPETKSYYLPQRLQSMVSLSLAPCLYQLRTIEEQSVKIKYNKFSTASRSSLLNSLTYSSSELLDVDLDEEEPVWRGVFPLSCRTQVLFSKEIELKVNELPVWKPHIVIDRYRLEDDDE